MAFPLINPILQFVDETGQPLAGALLFTYEPATTTKKTTYTTAALNSANTNPIELDDAGRCSIFLADGEIVKLVLAPATDTDPPTSPIETRDNVRIPQAITQSVISAALNPQTDAELAVGVTPTETKYASDAPWYDTRRLGIVIGDAGAAAANSTRIQDAVDAVEAAGGGTVRLPATGDGSYIAIDAPIIVPAGVSIIGDDVYGTIIKKTTATASSVSDNTVRRYNSTAVGFPICAFHLVTGASTNWSGTMRNLRVRGDTEDPNTTAVTYGIFTRGLSNGHIHRCIAEFVQVGFFLGAGSSIYSSFTQNVAIDCQRGFYCHGATSLTYTNNYANRFRYIGHALSSMYYSVMSANATDGGGYWREDTTEISIAYEINASVGSTFMANGCETQNGSVWKFTNNTSLLVANNLALATTSDYTGGSDVVLLEADTNISCVFTDNRALTSGMTGTGARHFMYKITSMLGEYIWARNRFVDSISDSTNTSVWANTSGTVKEYQENGSYTATLTGCTTSPTSTIEYTKVGDQVTLEIASNTATSNTTACTLTGMPANIRPTANQTIRGIVVTENSATAYGNVVVGTDGVLTLSVGASAAGFTNSGTKGINSCTITYRIA